MHWKRKQQQQWEKKKRKSEEKCEYFVMYMSDKREYCVFSGFHYS